MNKIFIIFYIVVSISCNNICAMQPNSSEKNRGKNISEFIATTAQSHNNELFKICALLEMEQARELEAAKNAKTFMQLIQSYKKPKS